MDKDTKIAALLGSRCVDRAWVPSTDPGLQQPRLSQARHRTILDPGEVQATGRSFTDWPASYAPDMSVEGQILRLCLSEGGKFWNVTTDKRKVLSVNKRKITDTGCSAEASTCQGLHYATARGLSGAGRGGRGCVQGSVRKRGLCPGG